MITKIRKKCQWKDCAEDATEIASGYEHKGKDGHPTIGCFCYSHAKRVANEGHPEYVEKCPNCGCVFGVN
jgi:hypothetical protein